VLEAVGAIRKTGGARELLSIMGNRPGVGVKTVQGEPVI